MLQKERLHNNYDFLRVLAALCITFTHSYNLLLRNDDEPLMKLTHKKIDFSFIGLSIFFAVSGYLIAKSAVKSVSFKNYLWKRLLRIQPLLIVVCVLSIFAAGPLFSRLSAAEYFAETGTYTYIRNVMPLFGIQFSLPGVFINNPAESAVNGSLWTLVVEERLYLIVGLLFLLKQKRRNIFIFFTALLDAVYFTHTAFFHSALINYLNGENVFYGLIFLNASCFYLLNIDFLKHSVSLLFFPAIIIFLSFFISPGKPLQVVFIPLFVIAAAHLKGLTNKAGKYGDLTYGIYIFSFPVQQMLLAKNAVHQNPLYLFLLTLAAVIPLAFASWHLLEKKMLLLKERIK